MGGYLGRRLPLPRLVRPRDADAAAGGEDEEVLRGKGFDPVDQLVPRRVPLGEHLLDRHPVLDVDVGGGIPLEAVLDQVILPPGARVLRRLASIGSGFWNSW